MPVGPPAVAPVPAPSRGPPKLPTPRPTADIFQTTGWWIARSIRRGVAAMIAATVNTDVVELSFKGRRRELYLNADHLEYRTGEYLIVQADRGEDIGVVVLSSHPMTLTPVTRGPASSPPPTPAPQDADMGDAGVLVAESSSDD